MDVDGTSCNTSPSRSLAGPDSGALFGGDDAAGVRVVPRCWSGFGRRSGSPAGCVGDRSGSETSPSASEFDPRAPWRWQATAAATRRRSTSCTTCGHADAGVCSQYRTGSWSSPRQQAAGKEGEVQSDRAAKRVKASVQNAVQTVVGKGNTVAVQVNGKTGKVRHCAFCFDTRANTSCPRRDELKEYPAHAGEKHGELRPPEFNHE